MSGMMIDIVLLTGPVACGKSSIGRAACELDRSIGHYPMGDTMRSIASGEVVSMYHNYFYDNDGSLIKPSELAPRVYADVLVEQVGRIGKSIILSDGYPRSIEDTTLLAEKTFCRFYAVIEITAPIDELWERYKKRPHRNLDAPANRETFAWRTENYNKYRGYLRGLFEPSQILDLDGLLPIAENAKTLVTFLRTLQKRN
jgi:adenylate kinase family enzyme